jgi:hypothetical protein
MLAAGRRGASRSNATSQHELVPCHTGRDIRSQALAGYGGSNQPVINVRGSSSTTLRVRMRLKDPFQCQSPNACLSNELIHGHELR